MGDSSPYQWRDMPDLRPEFATVLEYLEAELVKKGLPPEEVRIRLLKQANEFQEYEVGGVVLSDIPPPTGAGHFDPWKLDDGIFSRDFEGGSRTLHGFEIQIVGSQVKDTWRDELSTRRKLRIAGQAVLTSQEAQQVASAIWGDVQNIQRLNQDDNGT